MVLKTKICTCCEKEKAITSFARSNNYYYYRLCNDCRAKKKKEKENTPRLLKIFKKKKIGGSIQEYYNLFCSIRKFKVGKNYIINEFMGKFNLNRKYANQLAEDFESDNIKKITIDYEKNYIRS
jgi:hypothetical protein